MTEICFRLINRCSTVSNNLLFYFENLDSKDNGYANNKKIKFCLKEQICKRVTAFIFFF